MRNARRWLPAAAALVAALSIGSTAVQPPPVARETRPWTRWWWMGSAVDEAGITAELETLRDAGLGGVELTPIYGVTGRESRFVPYLSDRWMQLLEHTLREAARLDLGVDMATGTGWPFGGPWVGDDDACREMAYRRWTFEGGRRLIVPVQLEQRAFIRAIGAPRITINDVADPIEANPNLQQLAVEQVRYPKRLPLHALVAYLDAGGAIDLTSRVAADGTLDWNAPPGTWTLYGVFLGWHGKLVERAAPGGEGNVIDHFSRGAIRHYLDRFDRAFTGHRITGLRAFFNDSYEVDDSEGQADTTPQLFDEFRRRRGYDLREHLPALLDAARLDERVVADYRLTISDLLLDTFTTEWSAWARRHGAITRNQAHGSPANLLDLYAASDIPETEGTEIARARWASSAAHVAGRRLVSAEAATWLGEHFQTTLADVRSAVDRFFVSGINHIVYHGTAYSPRSEAWPGWQFYASVEFNARNSWWTDFSALNAYVTRVQSVLQAGSPGSDVLLYYPFYDTIASASGPRLVHFGNANPPPDGSSFERAAAILERRGYTYDFVSDRQLLAVNGSRDGLTTAGGARYKVLVIPASRFIPVETLERIVALARQGATVVAFEGVPTEAAGFADRDARQARVRAAMQSARGRIATGRDLEALLKASKVSRETLVDRGLQFARRQHATGRYYFIANPTDRDVDGWIALDDGAPRAAVLDAMTGRRGDVEARRSTAGQLEVRVSVPHHESVVVITNHAPPGESFTTHRPAGTPARIDGPWDLRFASGGPELPRARSIESLGSWTTLADDEARRFSGTAVYHTTFARPATAATAWAIDLGDVRDSASVRLNGQALATLIGPTFRVIADGSLLQATNSLEISVTNLMANRIAAMDRAGTRWRIFYNVNFPPRLPANRSADGLFSAARWEARPSGLLGPVTLTPLAAR